MNLKRLHTGIKLGAVFLCSTTVFFLIHRHFSFFVASDGFYHARHSALIASSGALSFVRPWVLFHFFSTNPTDSYFLSHLLQSFAISFFGVVTGTKLFASLMAAIVITTLYSSFRALSVKWPSVWTVVAVLSSATFLFRLFLERPFLISIALVIASFWALVYGRFFILFLLSILYMLSYHFFLFPILLCLLFFCVDYWYEKKYSYRSLISVVGGLCTGLLLHPNPFNTVVFLWQQTGVFILTKLEGIPLPSGGEVVLSDTFVFLAVNAIAIIASTLTYALFFLLIKQKRASKITTTAVLASLVWLPIASIYTRGAEYFIPFTWIAFASVWREVMQSPVWPRVQKQIKSFSHKRIIISVLIFSLICILLANTILVLNKIQSNSQLNFVDEYASASEFLKKNTEEGQPIFYPDWSLFAKLFYFNQSNKYIAAFDPVFLYAYDKELYWLWHNISFSATYCTHEPPCLELGPKDEPEAIFEAIRSMFKTDTILLKKTDPPGLFQNFLDSHPSNAQQIYENKKLRLYRLQ